MVNDSEAALRRWVDDLRAIAERTRGFEAAASEAAQKVVETAGDASSIEAFVRARIENALEMCVDVDIDIDTAAWLRAIELEVVTVDDAIATIQTLWPHAELSWLGDRASEALTPRRSESGANDIEDTIARATDDAVLRELPSWRQTVDVEHLLRLLRARAADFARFDPELSQPIAELCVALIEGDRAAIRAANNSLLASELATRDRNNDGGFTGRDGEDGPFIDLREALVERLIDGAEISAALRWIDRIAERPAVFTIGPLRVSRGAELAMMRRLRSVLTAERWAAIEEQFIHALSTRRSSTFEWQDLARWASHDGVELAQERATCAFEEIGAFIDPSWLDRARQRRVSIAAVERWSDWVSEFDLQRDDRDVAGSIDGVSARVRHWVLTDRENAERAWPWLAMLAARCSRDGHSTYRWPIARAIEQCAELGVEAARDEVARWSDDDAFGWSRWADHSGSPWLPDEILLLLCALPFGERKQWLDANVGRSGQRNFARVLSRDVEPDAEFVQWLREQPAWFIGEWLESAPIDPRLDADHLWMLLDRSAVGGRLSSKNGETPCLIDGSGSEWNAWAVRARALPGSRWSWSREQLSQWIEALALLRANAALDDDTRLEQLVLAQLERERNDTNDWAIRVFCERVGITRATTAMDFTSPPTVVKPALLRRLSLDRLRAIAAWAGERIRAIDL